jgi:hypothetical protein
VPRWFSIVMPLGVLIWLLAHHEPQWATYGSFAALALATVAVVRGGVAMIAAQREGRAA